MQVLSKHDVERAITMGEAIDAVADAFAQLSAGKATVPLRVPVEVPKREGVTLFMPGYLSESDGLAVKVVSVFPHNVERGLPVIHALVVVVDAETGRPLAAIEGGYLTALRTGAASGAATRLLAREDSRVLVCFGAGVQARTQIRAVCEVRHIERVWVRDLASERAERLAEELAGVGRIPQDVQVASSADVVRDADIVITATTSSTPVFDGRDLRPGTHINAIGAFTPQMQEVDAHTVGQATIVVGSRQACLAEAGDLIIPLEQGMIPPPESWTELGEIVSGQRPGRQSRDEITYFKTVGNAVQDVAVAQRILQAAVERGLGVEIDLG